MRFCNCRRVGSGEETGPATLTGNHNPGLSLTWTEITRGARGAPLLALSEKGPAEPPGALIAYSASSAPSPSPPPSPHKLLSSRERDPPPLRSPNSRLSPPPPPRRPPPRPPPPTSLYRPGSETLLPCALQTRGLRPLPALAFLPKPRNREQQRIRALVRQIIFDFPGPRQA